MATSPSTPPGVHSNPVRRVVICDSVPHAATRARTYHVYICAHETGYSVQQPPRSCSDLSDTPQEPMSSSPPVHEELCRLL
eukprot:885436-Amphidinium_carterae.1